MAQRAVVIAVDDEPIVARSVERDLLRHYADAYRVLRAESRAGALGLVERVLGRGEEVALVITDQRMPEMSGVELLARLREIAPDAKRVLLTAYADTVVAIRAINDVDRFTVRLPGVPWARLDGQLAAMLDGDPLGDVESEAGALPDLLSREERLEDPGHRPVRDPRAVVAGWKVRPGPGDPPERHAQTIHDAAPGTLPIDSYRADSNSCTRAA